MKRILLFALVVGLALSACRKKGNPNAGLPEAILHDTTTIEIPETEFNFDTIKQGEKVTHVFHVKNTGDHDLIIGNAFGSCGCTVPDYPKEPIAKGATADIKVTFNSDGKSGEQHKSVTLQVNTGRHNEQVFLTGYVIAPKEDK
ncbi:MAG: DUF1573 domain-containing protein [Chitinophagales bacterium]